MGRRRAICLFNTILSFHLAFYINSLLVLVLLIPLFIESLWAVELTETISSKVILYSVVFSFLSAQIALIISFWPLRPILASLFLTTVVYLLIGVGQQYFANRLFSKNIIEYTRVFIFVLLLILLTTSYR